MTKVFIDKMYWRLYRNRFAVFPIVVSIAILCLSTLFYWICSDEMDAIRTQTSSVDPMACESGLVSGDVIEQPFVSQSDIIDQLLIYIGTFGRSNNCNITIEILQDSELRFSQVYPAQGLENLAYNAFVLDSPITDAKNQSFLLRLYTDNDNAENAITCYFGNTVSASKVAVAVDIDKPMVLNGSPLDAMLCLKLIGRDVIGLKALYWPVISLVVLLFILVYLYGLKCYREKKAGPFSLPLLLKKYTFLIKQLVARDFKTKYKRSVLGVFWSFLNPLLTMAVQYIVFSSIFKSSIENFAAYLMTGIVIFNFFNESVGLGLSSIVWNSSLITKVYVPKYIYPASRVLSSLVNVVISMVPMMILMLISGIKLTKAVFLLPVVLGYTCLFCLGMSLILSSAMVFFRDTQFLWGIISMIWMYMTPIFYPENIIPAKYMTLYHSNPLYQFIYFLRQITLYGTAPGPKTFLYCTFASVIPFIIGVYVFKKTQDKFVFYL